MIGTRRRFLARAALAALALLAQATAGQAQKTDVSQDVVVFAAASLKNALDAIGGAYEKETGKQVVVSYAASSALAKQIESGAPAELFVSADLDWMDYLAEKKLIDQASRVNLLGNSLVLIAPKEKAKRVEVKHGFDLGIVVGDGRLAVADVAAVPAGKYAKAAMEKLGVWDSVKDKLAQAENVRAALLLVARGEAPAGIVYKTDAAAEPNVAIVGAFPEDSHPPIIYPAALTVGAREDARAFLAYLKTPAAKAAFEAQGFVVLGTASR